MKDHAYEEKYARVIANNFRRVLLEAGKTQTDLSRDLGISKATLSSWANGTRIPRMPKIDLLCHYFNISRSDLMEDHSGVEPSEELALSLPSDESDLLNDFRKLNSLGKEEAAKRVHELTELNRYTEKEEGSSASSAG